MTAGAAEAPLVLFKTIDARSWEPPEPMVRTLELLDELPRGKKIAVLLRYEPRPLFGILRANRFRYRSKFVESGYFEVTIWHAADAPASRARPD